MKINRRLIIRILLGVVLLTAIIILILSIISIKTSDKGIRVTRIIDGDTFKISTGETIRLLCVDTPEKNQENYEEAKNFLEDLILNKKIRLEESIDKFDKYNRLLRFAYINDSNNELFINQLIIDNNFSKVFPYGNETCDIIK